MTDPAASVRGAPRLRVLAAFALLSALTFAVYLPALHGGFVWDDDAHVTKPELRTVHGLWRIWFDLGATQQYYPLLHSAFWIEHRLWGDSALGYHLLNVLLHICAAGLVLLILRRLKVSGALLATAIFALHPVQVESVAWITEQKNTLSAVFYLASAWTYLRFDETRRTRSALLALALFTLALLSKPVTATLPAALLVVFWWQRGRLSWKRDALPLLPWFGLGAVSGLFTAWVEHSIIGAQGEPFALSAVERCLLAGRIVWFYLGKLLWPSRLIFVYPRWEIHQGVARQYLFPLAAAALLAVLWLLRRRSRAPLAALLFFVGTLFPVLGFFNVYLYVYSYVADHFQYLASLGVIACLSAAMTVALARLRPPSRSEALRPSFSSSPLSRSETLHPLHGAGQRPLHQWLEAWTWAAGHGVTLVLVGALAILTWLQCGTYSDSETLYRTTLARNPSCWMAANNLGSLLNGAGRAVEAADLLNQALRLKPDYAEARDNLGVSLMHQGRVTEAIQLYEQALRIQPDVAEIHNNLGNAYARQGRTSEAVGEYERALQLRPGFAAAHNNLGNALMALGRIQQAIGEFGEALQTRPGDAETHSNLGFALVQIGRFPDAIEQYGEVLRLSPDNAQAHFDLANVLAGVGRIDEAIEHYHRSLGLRPDFAEAWNNLGHALFRQGRVPEAIDQYNRALRIKPDLEEARANLRRAEDTLQRQP